VNRRQYYNSKYASFIVGQVALDWVSSPMRVHGVFAIVRLAPSNKRDNDACLAKCVCQGSKMTMLNPAKQVGLGEAEIAR
jgi:hypothetical protein